MKILIAEDDQALCGLLHKALEKEGNEVQCVTDGASVAELVVNERPDLLVLDLGLPKVDGMDVLRTLAASDLNMSILVLTGRSQVSDKIACLNMGADDYLVKPFSLHELVARCRALRRRRSNPDLGVLRHGELQMNRLTREVTFAGRPLDFTAKEFTLLEYLLMQRGRAVSRQELLREVWRMPSDTGTNVVDVYINYLRRKLGQDQADGVIETVRGEGYAIGLKAMPSKPAVPAVRPSLFPHVGAA
ncbi:MAG: response regulator transcription factor [Janthinobacterium lividum]